MTAPGAEPASSAGFATAEDLVGLALEVAAEGLSNGELPIGAVALLGDELLGRAYTQERTQGRRLVHAELLALQQVDRRLGWRARNGPLVLITTLEPCLMCLGASLSMEVDQIIYGLESPGDGSASFVAGWKPDRPGLPFTRVPQMRGGIRRQECRDLFSSYAATATVAGLRDFATQLAQLPG